MSIAPSDVSVVVQGPWRPNVAEVLASVRRHLPGAQLILSTWRGSVVGEPDVDVLVENDDPGSVPYLRPDGVVCEQQWSTNRMLLSTSSGLARATRPYALKMRTDTPLLGPDLLDWFACDVPRVDRMRVFRERVVTLSVATRPADRSPDFLFHPSDCVHFGLTEDVRLLWSGRPVDEAANAGYWHAPERKATWRKKTIVPQFFNEQILWLGALEAAGQSVAYPYAGAEVPGMRELSDLSIANNFVVVEPWQAGVAMPKLERLLIGSVLDGYLFFDDWRVLQESLAA